MERFRCLIAVHLFLFREKHILLLRRYNTGYADGQYSVIAGHLDGNEEIKTAMIREAQEEANIEIVPQNLEVVGVMHRKAADERIDFFLVATSWTGTIMNNEPAKCDDLRWFPLNELPENMVPYVRRELQNHLTGTWFDSLGWNIVGA